MTFFAVTAVFVIRGAETGSGYGVGEVVKRPDVPAEKNIFSGAVLTDERNISGVSAITECNRENTFLPQARGQVKIMHGSQRGTLPAVHQIVRTEIINHGNSGQIRQQIRIAYLQRIRRQISGNGRRKMIAGLSVETDGVNFIFRRIAPGKQLIDRPGDQ